MADIKTSADLGHLLLMNCKSEKVEFKSVKSLSFSADKVRKSVFNSVYWVGGFNPSALNLLNIPVVSMERNASQYCIKLIYP